MLVAAAGEDAMQPAACAAVEPMKSKFSHGALLYYGNSFAGVLLGTRDGTLWYQSSLPGSAPGDAERSRATTMLGIASGTSSTMPVQAAKPNVSELLAPDVKLRGCF